MFQLRSESCCRCRSFRRDRRWQGRQLGCSSFNCLLYGGGWRGLPGRLARCQHGASPIEWRISRTIDRGCHDRPSAMLDTASGIGEALRSVRMDRTSGGESADERRCAFRCPENGPAHRRGVLRRRGQGAVGRRAAAARDDPAEDPARCRASDRLSRGHRGRCYANIVGEEPIAVEAGEVIVFTKGDPHVLSSSPGMRAEPAAPRRASTPSPAANCRSSSTIGGDGPASAKLVCGFLACDARPFNPLLDNLPPVIKAGDPQGGDTRLARPVHPPGDDGIGGQARRRRKRARQAERADVHRGRSPAS